MVYIARLLPKRRVSRAAFRGSLSCPVCDSQAIRHVEDISQYRRRYRCRKCGMKFQYDFSNTATHPYAAFNKPKFRQIVEASKGEPKRRIKYG